MAAVLWSTITSGDDDHDNKWLVGLVVFQEIRNVELKVYFQVSMT
jgi:hypothetical protein